MSGLNLLCSSLPLYWITGVYKLKSNIYLDNYQLIEKLHQATLWQETGK